MSANDLKRKPEEDQGGIEHVKAAKLAEPETEAAPEAKAVSTDTASTNIGTNIGTEPVSVTNANTETQETSATPSDAEAKDVKDIKESEDNSTEKAEAPRLTAEQKGKGKMKNFTKLAQRFGAEDQSQGDDEDDDDDEEEDEEGLADGSDEDDDDDDPADLLTEEDLAYLKDVQNPGSRTRRKVIDFKKTLEQLRAEDASRQGKSVEDLDDEEDEEEDDDYDPNK